MNSFPALEVAIGLALTYLLLALISTTITEWFTRVTNSRGKTLVQGIGQLLGEEGARAGSLTQALFDHPLIKPLGQKKRSGYRKPSYIVSGLFAKALVDLLSKPPQASIEPGKEDSVPAATPQLKRALEALDVSHQKLEAAGPVDLKPIEDWYDHHMERVSGWYKRRTQTVVLITAVALTLVTNANTVGLVQRLWTDAPLRAAIVESAKTRLEQGPPIQTVEYADPTTPKPSKPVTRDNGSANQILPEEQELLEGMLGWAGEATKYQQNPYWWAITHFLGWFISALAISLGAPFWFDTLNRLMNIRSAGPSPAEAAQKK
jgi:hypothetical protein